MAEIVNLNKFRKQKSRQASKRQADENAVKFGQTKSDKDRDAEALRKLTDLIDQHKLDD